MTDFIDCTSLSFSYDIMGIVTVSYTVVHDSPNPVAYSNIFAGGKSFSGYIANVSTNPIPNTEGWYETNVSLVATTN